jgi:hypothetical protein
VDVESEEDATGILPPALRWQAQIVQRSKLSMQELDETMPKHQG